MDEEAKEPGEDGDGDRIESFTDNGAGGDEGGGPSADLEGFDLMYLRPSSSSGCGAVGGDVGGCGCDGGQFCNSTFRCSQVRRFFLQ